MLAVGMRWLNMARCWKLKLPPFLLPPWAAIAPYCVAKLQMKPSYWIPAERQIVSLPNWKKEMLKLCIYYTRTRILIMCSAHMILPVIAKKKQTGVDPDKKTSALTIGLHKDDESLYDMVETQCRWFGLPPQRAETPINHWLQDDEVFEFGRARLQTLHTPGHTAGSCSFILQNAGVVFTGDTLFAGGIGRTDLPGGDFQQILKSIRERLLRLDDATQVVPGHGGFTRIFEEKQQNPFLN